jgi:uncharacterized Zn finger protein (UPF0148 family)
MPQYTCPECKSVLKRAEPLPAGKKIKCPSCGAIFAPSGDGAAKAVPAKAAAGAAAAKKPIDDDIDRNPYAVRTDDEESDTAQREKRRAAAGIIADRFKKSARGPAQGEVVRPANFLLATGIINAIVCIVIAIIAIFPLVFRDFYSPKLEEGQKYSDLEKDGKPKKMVDPVKWRATVIQSSIMIGSASFSFIWCAFVCVGAHRMHTLDSYGWAMTGAIMGIFLLPMVTGIWALVTLRNPKVVAGFHEEKPDDV